MSSISSIRTSSPSIISLGLDVHKESVTATARDGRRMSARRKGTRNAHYSNRALDATERHAREAAQVLAQSIAAGDSTTRRRVTCRSAPGRSSGSQCAVATSLTHASEDRTRTQTRHQRKARQVSKSPRGCRTAAARIWSSRQPCPTRPGECMIVEAPHHDGMERSTLTEESPCHDFGAFQRWPRYSRWFWRPSSACPHSQPIT